VLQVTYCRVKYIAKIASQNVAVISNVEEII